MSLSRTQAEQIARQIAQTLLALEDDKKAQGGAALVAMMIAKGISESGRIEPKRFVELCGIKGETFRRKGSKIDPRAALRELEPD